MHPSYDRKYAYVTPTAINNIWAVTGSLFFVICRNHHLCSFPSEHFRSDNPERVFVTEAFRWKLSEQKRSERSYADTPSEHFREETLEVRAKISWTNFLIPAQLSKRELCGEDSRPKLSKRSFPREGFLAKWFLDQECYSKQALSES